MEFLGHQEDDMTSGLLKPDDLTKARKLIGKPPPPGKKTNEVFDGDGLSIRPRKTEASWTLRTRVEGKQVTLRMADLGALGLREARARRDDALTLVRRGIHPGKFLRWSEAQGGDLAAWESRPDAKRPGPVDVEAPGMTWAEAVTAYLASLPNLIGKHTLDDYRKTLRGPAFRAAGWDNRKLATLDDQDVKRLQDGLARAEKRSAARQALGAVQRVLEWAANTADTGIKVSVAAGIKKVPKASGEERPAPTGAEVGAAFWSLDKHATTAGVRLACALAMLTSQRRETVASARKEQFVNGVWKIPPAHIKGKREHHLPLPPLTAAVVDLAVRVAGSVPGGWLFPQERLRRKGDTGGGHLAAGTITHVFQDSNVAFSPHDTRRAFVQAIEEEMEYSEFESKLILHHAEGSSGDVTNKHYRRHQRLKIKAPVLLSWEGWLIEQIVAARPPGSPEWPAFLPPMPPPEG
jgi:integrase